MIPSVGLGISLDGDDVRPFSVVNINSPQYSTIQAQASNDPIHNMILQHSPPRNALLLGERSCGNFEDQFKTNTTADDILEKFRTNLALEKKQREIDNGDTVVVDDSWNMDFDLDAIQNAREEALKKRDVSSKDDTEKSQTVSLTQDDSSDDDGLPVAERVGRGTVVFRSALPTPKSTLITPPKSESSKSEGENSANKKPSALVVDGEVLVSSYYPNVTTPQAASVREKSAFDSEDDGYDSDFGPFNGGLANITEIDDDEETSAAPMVVEDMPVDSMPGFTHNTSSDNTIAITTDNTNDDDIPAPPMIIMTEETSNSTDHTMVFDNRRATVVSGDQDSDLIPPPPPLVGYSSDGSLVPPSAATSERRGSATLAVPGNSAMTRRGSASIISLASKFEGNSPSPTTPDRSHRHETDALQHKQRGSVSAMARRFEQKDKDALVPEDHSDNEGDVPIVIAAELLAQASQQQVTSRASIDAPRMSATLITPDSSPLPLRPRQAQMSLSFNTLPVKAAEPANTTASGGSGLFQLLSQTGTLRVVKRGKNSNGMGGTGKMVRIDVFLCSCSSETCASYKQTLTVFKDMTVGDVITLALELHNETQPSHTLPLDADVYEARLYDDDDEGPDLDMPALQKTAVTGTLNLSALCILPISLSDTDEMSTSVAEYDSDFGEFQHQSQNRPTVVMPVVVRGVAGPTGVTYSPSVHAVGSNSSNSSSKLLPPVLQIGGADDMENEEAPFEDADDYTSPLNQVNLDILQKTPSNKEEMEFYIHALYSQFTPASVAQYKEWHVVKTNTKGRRQERWMGLDRHFIYNRAAPKESGGLFANLGVSKESRPVQSISHCAVHPDNIHSLSISYKTDEQIDTRQYETASPKECAAIVARIRYLLNNP